MHRTHRIAALAGLATLVLNGLLVWATFPFQDQFTKYPQAAAQYLAGTLPTERILDFSAFYLYLHVLGAAFVPGATVVYVQVAVASLSASLMFLLLDRTFPTWAAVAGAVAFATSRGLVVYTPVLEPEIFLVCFLLGFLYFVGEKGERSRAVAGVFLALALAIRPSVLPLLAVVPVGFWLREGRERWLRGTLLVLGSPLLVLVGLGLRNQAATGSLSPLGMNPGFVFYEGNNPLSSGGSAAYPPLVGELKSEIPEHPDNPHLTYRLIASRASGRDLSPAQANRFWRQRAFDFIADEPGRFVSLLGTKAYGVVREYRRHDLQTAERYDRRLRDLYVPGVPFALLTALALVGLIATLPDWRRSLLLYALLASQASLMVLLYVSERQRLAILPCVVFFACAGLVYLTGASVRRRWMLSVGVAVLSALLMVPDAVAREDQHLWSAYQVYEPSIRRAFSLRDAGDLREAAREAARAYAAAPWRRDYARPAALPFPQGFAAAALAEAGPESDAPSKRFDRGLLLLDAGRLDDAGTLFQDLLTRRARFDRGYSGSSEPLYYLARISALGGDRAGAVVQLQAALRSAPGDPFVLAELAALTGDASYQERIARYFSAIDADFLIGLARLEHGDENAVLDLAQAVQRLPEFWRGQIYFAAALGARGDPELAASLYGEATALRTDPVLLEEALVPILAAAAQSGSGTALFQFGLLLARFGRFDEALVVFRRAQEVDPTVELAQAIEDVERLKARAGSD